jgi:hypothetical protein
MKEEQSERRLVKAGLRTSVALTPRRQLLALHPARSDMILENAHLAATKARKIVKVFIFEIFSGVLL